MNRRVSKSGLPGPGDWIFPARVLTAPSLSAAAIKHEHKGNWLEERATVPFALFHRVGLSLGESGLPATSFVAGRKVSVLWLNRNDQSCNCSSDTHIHVLDLGRH